MLTLVIGAGPAGAACALWLHQLGCPVLLLDKDPQAGGLQKFSPYENVWIPSVRGLRGEDVARSLHAQLAQSGVPMRTSAEVVRVETHEKGFVVHLADAERLCCSQLVLATGARFRSAGLPVTARVGIGPGRNFEALDVAGKRLAILGGGDNAFDAYNFARNRGAAFIRIFARTLRAQKKLMDTVPCEHVVQGSFEVDTEALTVNGEPFDAISVQFGFEAVVPTGLEALERTSQGYVAADHWGVTSLKNVYAAGEVANTLHPCVTTSFAHGIQVAKHIQKVLGR